MSNCQYCYHPFNTHHFNHRYVGPADDVDAGDFVQYYTCSFCECDRRVVTQTGCFS